MKDKVILVTGATDGLGKAVAHKIASEGARLIIHGRSEPRCRGTCEELKDLHKNYAITYLVSDFTRLDDIFNLITQIKATEAYVDVVINNAGVGVETEFALTENGIEKVLQVNYLSTYAITVGLEKLVARRHGRVICVSSASQAMIDFDDPNYINDWIGAEAYGRSKWAQVAFAAAYARTRKGNSVTIHSVHPGSFMPTKLVVGKYPVVDSIEKGVSALWNLATFANPNTIDGEYFNGLSQARSLDCTYDHAIQERLVEMSERMLSNFHSARGAPTWSDISS